MYTFLSQWPWILHMWGVKGVIIGEWPWNLAGVSVLGRCICVPSFVVLRLVVVEKIPTGGFFDFVPLDFASKFHLSYKMFKFLFLNQHVLNRVSLPAEDWRQHTGRAGKDNASMHILRSKLLLPKKLDSVICCLWSGMRHGGPVHSKRLSGTKNCAPVC